MKACKLILIALVSLPLLGCPMKPKYLTQPEVIKAEGTYTHTSSGMTFPPRVGDFQRGTVLRYDTEGLDESVGYNLVVPFGAVASTVYVYPAPPLISIGSPPAVVATARAMLSQGEFEKRKKEILLSHPGARLIHEKSVSLPQGSVTYSGKMATLEFEDVLAGRRQALRSDLYLFCYVDGKWAIKYRFTYPRDLDVAKEIEAFMQNLRWTVGGS